jgi:hypothetical protein
MKGDCAVRYTDCTMRTTQATGSLPCMTCAAFHEEFIREFCPKNKVQSSQTELETLKYHQGSCSVDEYVNEFCKLVDCAKYTEGANIILKFCHGLQQSIQNYITCLTYGCPSDDSLQEWYDTAILCDENCIANSAFQSTFCMTQTGTSVIATLVKPSFPSGSTSFWPTFTPSLMSFTLKPLLNPDVMDVDATHRCGLNPMFCYHCGKTGHLRPDCPQCFDVCTMSSNERSDFVQHEPMALDVRTTDTAVETTEPSTEYMRKLLLGRNRILHLVMSELYALVANFESFRTPVHS